MPQFFYDRETRSFTSELGPARISVPASVHKTIREDQLAGKAIECEPGGTPVDVAALLTLSGMRAAVFRELREQRAGLLNALTGVGFDAHHAGDTVLADQVAAARTFLKNITADTDVLAVTVEQGAEYMRNLILTKYKVYAYGAPAAIRNAFKEIA